MRGAAHGWPTVAALAAMAFGALAGLALQLAPLGLQAGTGDSPDLVWCVLAYFALRRPDVAHPLPVFALGLVHDMATSGPFGAGALLMLLASEVLRMQAFWLSTRSVLLEWLAAALAAAAILVGEWVLLMLSFADPPSPAELAPRLALTIAAFPIVAAFYRYILRIGAIDRGPEKRLA